MMDFRRNVTRLHIFYGILTIVTLVVLLIPHAEISPIGPRAMRKGLTVWTVLRDLKQMDATTDQTAWLEQLQTYNAVNSWVFLEDVDIMLFGSSISCRLVKDAIHSSSIHCYPIPCENDEFHVPRYDCLFAKAAELAETEYIMYANSDVVFFNDLISALLKVSSSFYDFLIVGQRIDVVYSQRIDFSQPDWNETLNNYAQKFGSFHGKYGIDYFIYRTSLTRKMPPFVVGRVRWDNWLLAEFIGTSNAATIDATKTITAIHLNHMKVGESHQRNGSDFNIGLSSAHNVVDPKKIGDIESTDYVLVGDEASDQSMEPLSGDLPIMKNKCPQCRFEKREQSLDVTLFKHAIDGNIIIATVNYGYVDFALNLHCSLQRVGVSNYIFHAVDETIYEYLRRRNLPVVLFESEAAKKFKEDKDIIKEIDPNDTKEQTQLRYLLNKNRKGHKRPRSVDEPPADESPTATNNDFLKPLNYGSVAYQAVMNSRTEFIYRVLNKGYNVLLCDLDIVFLRNPFTFLNSSVDLQGGVHKKTKITGGFIYTRSTSNGRMIWQKVFYKHRSLFQRMQTMETYNPHEMTEQEIINNLLITGDKDLPELSWRTVEELADGKRFFMDQLTLKNGEWPMAIHNNFIIGHENKRMRFMNSSLWFLKPDRTCKQFPQLGPSPPSSELSLVIKILAYNRPVALARLLQSLKAESYLFDKINLDIFIDSPDQTQPVDAESESNRTLVIQMANEFKWEHGKKEVVIRKKHYGLVGQWLNCWFPASDHEFALILEDDNALVPGFYSYIKASVNHFFFKKENFDPRVFAFNLQHQHMIAGRYPTKPSELLPPNTLFYKYQLLSTWAPVFSPWHWGQFITWFAQRDENFLPLFSNLITNTWFLKRSKGNSVWSAYFIRFAAERGLYSIYTNFPNEQSFVINYRDRGVNFDSSKGANGPGIQTLTPEMKNFPPGPSLPIYDFQFNQITEDPSILEGRAFYADPKDLMLSNLKT